MGRIASQDRRGQETIGKNIAGKGRAGRKRKRTGQRREEVAVVPRRESEHLLYAKQPGEQVEDELS
eukprot:381505-Hanusia_phi.AAC.2